MLEAGSRSPLNSRLTEKLGGLAANPAPTIGSAKNGMTLTKNSASAVIPNAPAMRTNSLAIGLLRSSDAITPAIHQAHEKPPSRPQHRVVNVRHRTRFHDERRSPDRAGWMPPLDASRCTSAARPRGKLPSCDKWKAAGTKMALGTCHGGRPSFPPPPVLGRSMLGAVDMPIGCALTFC